VNQEDPAWQIAEATVASISNGPDTLDATLVELRASARDIARAYALCLTGNTPFSQNSATRLILESRMHVALVEEHVQAQKRMGRTVNILTFVIMVMTGALVYFGGIDVT